MGWNDNGQIADATKQIQDEYDSVEMTPVLGRKFGGYAALAMSYKYNDIYECVLVRWVSLI